MDIRLGTVTGDLLTALLVVYGPDGARLYRAGAPSATERPAPRLNEGVFAAGTRIPMPDPHRMTPDARFAYIAIAVDDGRVYALFVGRSPVAEEGIATRSVHVFDEETGGYLGTLRLPEAVTSIDVLGREVIALRWEPVPSLFLLRMDGPPA